MGWVSLVVRGVLLGLGVKLLDDLGAMRVVYSQGSEGCVPVKGGPETGAEDAALLADGRLLITSGIRMPMVGRTTGPGAFFLLNPAASPPVAMPVPVRGLPEDAQLFPAGIAVFQDPSGTSVFVVNTGDNNVLKFSLAKGGLIYESTMDHELFHVPNNIVALSHDEIYVSNFFRSRWAAGQWVEAALQLPLGSVVRCVRGSCVVAASGIKGANGLALSADRRTLYVGTIFSRELLLMDVAADGTLSLRSSVALRSHADNLSVGPDGSVLVGSSHSAGRFSLHMARPTTFAAPALVLRVPIDAHGQPAAPHAALQDDGSRVSGIAVAFQLPGNRLYLGTLQTKAFICQQ